MGVQTLCGIPRQFAAGDTLIFTETYSNYPTSDWTAKLVLSSTSGAPTIIDATVSGLNFLFTISATISAAIPYGGYQYAQLVSSAGQVATARTGGINVLPNLAVAQTPTEAQAMVTLLSAAIQKLATGTNEEVNFNGQMFRKRDLAKYREELVFWQAKAIREQDELKALRGESSDARIQTRFAPTFNQGFGFYGFPWNGDCR